MKDDDTARMPYQLPFPKDAQEEIVIPNAMSDDDKLWVPQAENVWFRPLCLNRSQGYWMNLLKVKKAGVLSRHRHPQPVHGFVLKGRWHYLEHDWVAEEGGYVYEPPGETHTLVVPDDVEEMVSFRASEILNGHYLSQKLWNSLNFREAVNLMSFPNQKSQQTHINNHRLLCLSHQRIGIRVIIPHILQVHIVEKVIIDGLENGRNVIIG